MDNGLDSDRPFWLLGREEAALATGFFSKFSESQWQLHMQHRLQSGHETPKSQLPCR